MRKQSSAKTCATTMSLLVFSNGLKANKGQFGGGAEKTADVMEEVADY